MFFSATSHLDALKLITLMFLWVPTFSLAKIPEIILQALLRKIHLSHFVQSSCWLCTDTKQFHSRTPSYSFYNTRIRQQPSKYEQPAPSLSWVLNPCGFTGSCSARRFGGRFRFSTPSQEANQGGGSGGPRAQPRLGAVLPLWDSSCPRTSVPASGCIFHSPAGPCCESGLGCKREGRCERRRRHPWGKERKETGTGRDGVGAGAWPVRHLLLREALVALQQDGDVVADHAHEEGDEDDGQHHPQTDVGIQQQLGLAHRDSVPDPILIPASAPTRLPLGLRPLPGRPRPRLHFRFRCAPEPRHRAPTAGSSSSGSAGAAWGVAVGARWPARGQFSSSAVTRKGESTAISLS